MKPIKLNMSSNTRNNSYTYDVEKKQQSKAHKSLRDAKKGRKGMWDNNE
jgi:hypothetical protein